MSFEETTPIKNRERSSLGTPHCRVGMWFYPGSTLPPRLAIVLHESILTKLGPLGKYRFAIGLGEDAHLVRLVADPKGPFKPAVTNTQTKHGFHYRFVAGLLPRMPNCRIPFVEANWECKNAAIFVEIPAWGFDANTKREIEKRNGPVRSKPGIAA